jgi:hypothetical protein
MIRHGLQVNPEDCSVCLLPCDPEIHRATLNIRDYLRSELTRMMLLPDKPAPSTRRPMAFFMEPSVFNKPKRERSA